MFETFYLGLKDQLYHWLTDEPPPTEVIPYDFNKIKYELRPGDVLLIEGRSRISRLISKVTASPWTHAALYVGRLNDIEDEEMVNIIHQHIDVKDNVRLIIEGMLDKGTIVVPLSSYKNHHIRICRPIGLSAADRHLVINYAIKSLGKPYNVRQLFDLMRFLLPWSLLPRRWGSSLFRTASGEPEGGICSSLIAEAFSSVQFPVLPYIKPDNQGLELYQRNPHLFTPKDFDFSPYFEIIKYPLFNPDEPLPYYRRLPWTKSGFMHQDEGILSGPKTKRKLKIFSRKHSEETNISETKSNKDKNDPII